MKAIFKGFQVLLIDDDLKDRDRYQELLKDYGAHATPAGSGEEALSILERQPFSAILLDKNMPVMDGLMFLSRARDIEFESDIIMLTAYESVRSAVKAMNRGAYNYIAKGDIDLLMDALEEIAIAHKMGISRIDQDIRRDIFESETLSEFLRQDVIQLELTTGFLALAILAFLLKDQTEENVSNVIALATEKLLSKKLTLDIRDRSRLAELGKALPACEDIDTGQIIEEVGFFVESNAPDYTELIKDLTEDKPDARRLIAGGENEKVEFKATLRRNIHTGQNDEAITFAVLKTIAAFLNSSGGDLLIGVEDNGNIGGLERDGFPSEDKILLFLYNSIRKRMGNKSSTFVHASTHRIEDKTLCLIHCDPGSEAVYIDDNQFYIRTGPGTTPLSQHETVEYCRSRWHT